MDQIKVFTDGGSRGNPGPSAYGFVVLDEKDDVIKEGYEYLGVNTNNFAEYTAVLEAFKFLSNHFEPKQLNITLSMDSELVKRQLTGEYRVKSPTLSQLFEKIKDFEEKFNIVNYNHVRREYNHHADKLVNEALDRALRKS